MARRNRYVVVATGKEKIPGLGGLRRTYGILDRRTGIVETRGPFKLRGSQLVYAAWLNHGIIGESIEDFIRRTIPEP